MGQIKRIQFRGISRTPSDRMTQDGGCAESLNVFLDNDEIAPVIKPKVIDIGIPDGATHDRIFVHKTIAKEIYIAIDSNRIGYYENGKYNTIITLFDEQVRDVTSIGNSLIFATDKGMKYVLYKNGEYEYLGDKLPKPEIEFRTESAPDQYASFDVYNTTMGDPVNSQIDKFNVTAWKQALDDIEAGKSNDNTERVLKINDGMWATIKERASNLRKDGVAVFPRLVRYAVKLYDGSYIYQSVPYLLGAGRGKFAEITAYYNSELKNDVDYREETFIEAKFNGMYKSKLYLNIPDLKSWSDIIESIDLFVSTEIAYPYLNSAFKGIKRTAHNFWEEDNVSYSSEEYSFDLENGDTTDEFAMEQEILSKSLFYKVESFDPYKDNGIIEWDINKALRPISQDVLVTFERLPDYEQSDLHLVPSRIFSLNNRVIVVNDQKQLPEGYLYVQSANILSDGFAEKQSSYTVAYTINSNDGPHRVVLHSPMFTYESNNKWARIYGLLFHPDARCTKAEIRDNNSGIVYSVEMKAHPGLNCAYAYWGLSKSIEDIEDTTEVSSTDFVKEENRTETDSMKIYQSAMDNPFYFPLTGNLSLQGKVLGVAVATNPLSQGQFGQYPLYAFTSEGIWAMETNSLGDIVSSAPISREVCINPDSITPLDNSVLFMSSKGLMNLSGRDIVSLSPNMSGRHYTIEQSAKTIINGQDGFSVMADTLSDSSPFLSFMKDAKIGYDYAGQRLICINSNEEYQYVYKLDTNTWHKVYYGKKLLSPINSYPECSALVSDNNTSKILDLTTRLDSADSLSTEKGVIASRPFDLDEPDVFKTITDIRVRGQFQKGSVNFILLGSNDGINFYTISTLRGKAWKQFRIILLSKLSQHERISWIDVQYDTKFTNRLR